MIGCEPENVAKSLFSEKVHCGSCFNVIIEAAKICKATGQRSQAKRLAEKAIAYCLDGDGYASEKVWAGHVAEDLGLTKRANELYRGAVVGFIKDLEKGGLDQAFSEGESYYFIPDTMIEIAEKFGLREELLQTALHTYELILKEVKNEDEKRDFESIIKDVKEMMQ